VAVHMRLRRMGSTKRPFYRIVVAESHMPRDGRFIEIIGHYNPIADPAEITVDEEKVYQWLRQGAQPTDTVRSLLQKTGTWKRWGLLKRGLKITTMDASGPTLSPGEPSVGVTDVYEPGEESPASESPQSL